MIIYHSCTCVTPGKTIVAHVMQVSRGLLPDVGSEFEGDGGSISDAIEFLLVNFTEMNKLWVRMQHQGASKDRSLPAPLVHLSADNSQRACLLCC